MKISDRLFGLLFVALGVAVALYGLGLPVMGGQAYGAGLFPAAVGSCLAIGGAALSIGGWQRRSTEAVISRADWGRSRPHVINLLLVVGSILAFALLIRQVGFAVLAFATTAVLLVRFGEPIWRALIVALVAATAFQLLFVSLMRVPLPPGILMGLVY